MKFSFRFYLLLMTVVSVSCQDIIFPGKVNDRSAKRSRIPVDKRSFPRTGAKSRAKCQSYKKAHNDLMEEISKLSLGGTGGVNAEFTNSACHNFTGRIIPLIYKNPNELPHMAAIAYETSAGYSFNCGGSIVSERFILTAAHCRDPGKVEPIFVRLGELQLSEESGVEKDVDVEEFIKHPGFNKETRQHDIALIRLAKDIEFYPFTIRPACLDTNEVAIDTRKNVAASGWGFLSPKGHVADILQKIPLDILNNRRCRTTGNKIFNTQICAGVDNLAVDGVERDTCEGDSGGPLHATTTGNDCVFDVIGVVSYGSSYCGSAPAVYTRVSSYIGWIEGIVWPETE